MTGRGLLEEAMLSERFAFEVFRATRRQRIRQADLAAAAGVAPSKFSGWLRGTIPVRDGDPCVIRLGELVGLKPEECFASLGGPLPAFPINALIAPTTGEPDVTEK
jgi:hypothetical protein